MIPKTLEWKDRKLIIIDQTLLPGKLVYKICQRDEEVVSAIKALQVRGAPAIGCAAAYGVVLGLLDSEAKNYREFTEEMDRVVNLLASSRPTAVNLFWALSKMEECAWRNKDKEIPQIVEALEEEAKLIHLDDQKRCERIGEEGATLIPEGARILTHCNAGALATGGIGTALGVIYKAEEQGKRVKVFSCETRPLLQGARLTCWELKEAGIDVTLICDNMAASLMREEKINLVITGADRICANGDVANKIGTYGLAVLAKAHRIPFYVAAPLSTFDLALSDGSKIPIEERDREEVASVLGKQIAPKNVKVLNPAFDITPNELVTAIITEKGIIRSPYEENIKRVVAR
ncbi:S-methyl-5-thioribose-1-phosphate isomerase [bacterium]|nr:S-methyl-5-thioribose-1-phosphate isomerase [bacterium]MBU1614510.1 S-methyl-5-thioribose-1-phosphate isomerase [bacterium]